METICRIAALIAMAGFCPLLHANDSYTEGVGGGAMLMRGHPTVVMESAGIALKLQTAQVECNYVMHNTGPATDVTIGFPERSENAAAGGFKDFHSYVNGQEVPVKPLPAAENDFTGGFHRFWVKEAHFDAGQSLTVRNTYTGGKGKIVSGEEWFIYDVCTAASWKGTVGDLRVTMDVGGMGPGFDIIDLEPAGYERSGDTIVWHWTDLEPSKDIRIDFILYYNRLWIDGEHRYVLSLQPGDYSPMFRDGVLSAGIEYIAEWLGMDTTQDEEQFTLTGRGKTAAFAPGKEAFSLDGREMPLGMTARIVPGADNPEEAQHTFLLPLQPIAEAFGFLPRFDPKTRRTYLFSPEAQTVAPPPAWLARALTENDLSGVSDEDLRFMRNEIYARHGRAFENAALRERFYCQPWYQPDPGYTDQSLSETDRINVEVIAKTERARGTSTGESADDSEFMPPGGNTSNLIAGLKQYWRQETEEDPIVACLNADDETLRFEAACLLGILGDARAFEPLMKYVNDRSDYALYDAISCINGLAGLNDPRVIPALLMYLKHPEPEFRLPAAAALKSLGYQPKTEEERLTLLLAGQECAKIAETGPSAIRLVLECVRAREYTPHNTALKTAGMAREMGAAVLEPLAACLNDDDKELCLAAAETLALLGDARGKEFLTRSLNDDDHSIRHWAEEALKTLP